VSLHERKVVHGHHTVRRVGVQSREQLSTERIFDVESIRGWLLLAEVGKQRHLGVRILIAVGKRDIYAVHLNTILMFIAIRSLTRILFLLTSGPRVREVNVTSVPGLEET